MIAGLLIDNMAVPEDTGQIYLNPNASQGAYLFPQGGGRVRAYSSYPDHGAVPASGRQGHPDFHQ